MNTESIVRKLNEAASDCWEVHEGYEKQARDAARNGDFSKAKYLMEVAHLWDMAHMDIRGVADRIEEGIYTDLAELAEHAAKQIELHRKEVERADSEAWAAADTGDYAIAASWKREAEKAHADLFAAARVRSVLRNAVNDGEDK